MKRYLLPSGCSNFTTPPPSELSRGRRSSRVLSGREGSCKINSLPRFRPLVLSGEALWQTVNFSTTPRKVDIIRRVFPYGGWITLAFPPACYALKWSHFHFAAIGISFDTLQGGNNPLEKHFYRDYHQSLTLCTQRKNERKERVTTGGVKGAALWIKQRINSLP